MPRPNGQRLHILVVDDDASIREALRAALADGYIVHVSASGDEACDMLLAHPVAAVILDAVLRGEHGLDLVERFRKLSPAPIVILTGHGTEDLAVRALRAHVAEYLKKPVSVTELLATVSRLAPETQRSADLVARARRFLEEYPPKTFRAADLAGRLGMSETHARRLFRAAHGQTPRQYLAEVRMRRAADLLRRDGRGVKEVASEIGYTDLRLFRRTFIRLIGMPPAAWRRRHQGTAGSVRAERP
jgi:YesN/AraC family two-component response regulator